MSIPPASGRMSWTEAVAGPLAGATCLWQDLDGLHVGAAPETAPPTSILWAWRPDSWLVRARLDSDVAFVAVHDGAGLAATVPWDVGHGSSAGDLRVAASRGPRPIGRSRRRRGHLRAGRRRRDQRRGRTGHLPAPGMSMSATRRRGPAWLHPGWSWTVGRAWVITALSASVTLILGAVLGALPALLAGSWHDAQTRDQTWILIGFAAVSVAAAATAIRAVPQAPLGAHARTALPTSSRNSRPTGPARTKRHSWTPPAATSPASSRCPGPGQLGRSWDWPLDDRGQRWDAKVTELARSFQALHRDDDPATPNGMLMWAWWAVAAAFGMRVTAADRDLVLDVWQRPSHARAGDVDTRSSGPSARTGSDPADPVPLAQILPESAPQRIHLARQAHHHPAAAGAREPTSASPSACCCSGSGSRSGGRYLMSPTSPTRTASTTWKSPIQPGFSPAAPRKC